MRPGTWSKKSPCLEVRTRDLNGKDPTFDTRFAGTGALAEIRKQPGCSNVVPWPFIPGKLMLAIHNYLTIAVFAISLDNCDHLWWFRFFFFDYGRVVRIVTIV